MKRQRILSVLLLSFVLVQLSACSGRATIPVGEIPQAQVPDLAKRKSTLSAAYGYAQQNGYSVTHDARQEKRLQSMVDRMARAAGAQGFSYPVVLIDAGEDVNAAAMNGSVIMVYQGLLKRVRNDDELATIIGHEVAHIVTKHHEDDGAEGREAAVSIGSSLIGLAAGVGAAVAGAGSTASGLASDLGEGVSATVGTGAFVRSYDRDMEREADQVGLMIMSKAGYNPEAAVTLWQRADEVFGEGGGGGSFLSTHPTSSDRLERIQEAMPVAKKYFDESRQSNPLPLDKDVEKLSKKKAKNRKKK